MREEQVEPLRTKHKERQRNILRSLTTISFRPVRNQFFHCPEEDDRYQIKTNEPRSRTFLKQRLSMAVQKENAAAVMGTFRSSDKMEEIFYLL